jgi:MFS family permease
MNIIMPMSTFAAILTFIWPFARSEAAFVIIAILYGLGCGTYVALCPNPIMAMGDIEDGGRRVGMFFVASAMGAMAGPPISGAIDTATKGFAAVGYFAGESWSGEKVILG